MQTFIVVCFLLGIVAVIVHDYKKFRRQDKAAKPEPPLRPMPPPRPEPSSDPFLNEIAQHRAALDAAKANEVEAHKREMAAKFEADLALKNRLAAFAKEQRLDRALIQLWQEIRNYPAWSKRDDFDKWIKLPLTNISEAGNEGAKEITFDFDGRTYLIVYRESPSFDDSRYADLSLFEQSQEQFALSASIDYLEFGSNLTPLGIGAFRKEGDWARMLLTCQSIMDATQEKASIGMRYYKADEIKDRFKE